MRASCLNSMSLGSYPVRYLTFNESMVKVRVGCRVARGEVYLVELEGIGG